MRIFDTFGHAFADMKSPPDKETYFPTDNQPVVDDRILTFYRESRRIPDPLGSG
ncbi:hypothetical protein [Halorubrum xinjiangense]|uniref:hypothetical protein n=1 Tax=Halorubrum xinjiangense TaxID=261291 RepID=UPI00165F6F15|nr:hypothetical protein [Halorubrum xinjiangense]